MASCLIFGLRSIELAMSDSHAGGRMLYRARKKSQLKIIVRKDCFLRDIFSYAWVVRRRIYNHFNFWFVPKIRWFLQTLTHIWSNERWPSSRHLWMISSTISPLFAVLCDREECDILDLNYPFKVLVLENSENFVKN